MKFDTNRYFANIAMDNIIVRSIISSDLPTEIKYPVTTKYQLEDGTKINGSLLCSMLSLHSILVMEIMK